MGNNARKEGGRRVKQNPELRSQELQELQNAGIIEFTWGIGNITASRSSS